MKKLIIKLLGGRGTSCVHAVLVVRGFVHSSKETGAIVLSLVGLGIQTLHILQVRDC